MIIMQLNKKGLADRDAWKAKQYNLPEYDRDLVIQKTKEAPFWIHFGAGNIFRAFQANVVQNLLNQNKLEKGLIVAEGYDYEIIEKMNRPHDDYSILVTLKADGHIERTVVGSIVESLTMDSENLSDSTRLSEIFCSESLQMASFTITEKGYSLVDGNGCRPTAIELDMKNGPLRPASYVGKVTALLYQRYLAGAFPIAMVSMDNCSHNGDKLYSAVEAYAKEWEESNLVEKGFLDYVSTPSKVSFPWSMIDKITPRPDPMVKKSLEKDDIEDLDPIITSKNTYVAPFVNAEECEYLVIEDSFPGGRPTLEEGGVIFTTRDVVDKVEKMKVCTCLNPLHTALAVFGCLLGYDLISKEMDNPKLRRMVEIIGYEEGLPVVVDPGIINPKLFIDEVLKVRIPNPFMPDTPQRIATDTSQKLAIRFGETIKAYVKSSTLDVRDLKIIPLIFAGWLRYLMGIDDKGERFELNPDPLLETLCPQVENIKLGQSIDVRAALKPILTNEKIFGVNLYDVGLGEIVCDYFKEMITGVNAVETVLDKYIN